MARLIQTGDTPAKRRHAHRRSCAEVLRLLAQRRLKDHFDDEAKDMAAFLVFHLRGIYKTIDESAQTWDDKGYWKKAEGLRERWRWSQSAARTLAGHIRINRRASCLIPTWNRAPARCSSPHRCWKIPTSGVRWCCCASTARKAASASS